MIRRHHPRGLARPFNPASYRPRPLELTPYEIHPHACDCPQCDDPVHGAGPLPLAAALAECAILALVGVLTGQLIGWALKAAGVLAAIGIG